MTAADWSRLAKLVDMATEEAEDGQGRWSTRLKPGMLADLLRKEAEAAPVDAWAALPDASRQWFIDWLAGKAFTADVLPVVQAAAERLSVKP